MLLSIALYVSLGLALLEGALFYLSPRALGRLAWRRLGGPKALPLGALAPDAGAEVRAAKHALYREAPAQRLELGSLHVAPSRDEEAFAIDYDLGRGRAFVRAQKPMLRLGTVARVDFAIRNGSLVASAHYLPIPVGLFLLIGVLGWVHPETAPQKSVSIQGLNFGYWPSGLFFTLLCWALAFGWLLLTRNAVKAGAEAAIADVFAAVRAAQGAPGSEHKQSATAQRGALRGASTADLAPGAHVAEAPRARVAAAPFMPLVRVANAIGNEQAAADERAEADEQAEADERAWGEATGAQNTR